MTVLQIKAAVRARDGMRCTKCGLTNDENKAQRKGRSLEVHRIVPGSVYSLEGCVTLCMSCHDSEPKRARGEADGDRMDLRANPEWFGRIFRQSSRLQMSAAEYIRMTVTKQLEQDEATDPG